MIQLCHLRKITYELWDWASSSLTDKMEEAVNISQRKPKLKTLSFCFGLGFCACSVAVSFVWVCFYFKLYYVPHASLYELRNYLFLFSSLPPYFCRV